MSEPKPDNLIPVYVDDVEVRVPPGTNMVEAAKKVGREIPHYCYHPQLSVVGNCRMCLVEMGMPATDPKTRAPLLDEQGRPKTNWMPRPAIACATTASPGLRIKTDSPMVKECREGVMEFLLVNHPLDCPICDQAGECRLQEFATDYGRGYSRFVEQKNVKPKRTRLGPRVMLDDERCILCSRCIRFSKEIAKEDVLGFIDRGSYSTLTCFPGKQLEHNYSLNTVDICPVGALTSTDFRFQMRVWFLKQAHSLCPESSAGVNTVVWSREGKVHRITPRRNDAVNDSWMPDSGRALYKQLEAPDRVAAASVDGRKVAVADAVVEAARRLKGRKVAVVGSGRSSIEEQYLLRLVAAQLGAKASLVSRTGEGDGLLVTADRNPNVRGALLAGLVDTLPSATLDGLAADLAAGRVDAVLTVGEDLAAAGIPAESLRKAVVVAVATHASPTTEAAAVVIPGLLVWEKSGAFVNQQFRVQRFRQAVPGPAGVYPDLAVLSRLLAELGGTRVGGTPDEVWPHLATAHPGLAGLTPAALGEEGVVVDPGTLAALPYVEGPSLHHKPAAAAAGAKA